MDNASKNAGDMINRFQILFNRTRQAVITGELVEIITGYISSPLRREVVWLDANTSLSLSAAASEDS